MCLQGAGSDMLAIVPKFFILPRDFDEFKLDLERNPRQLYIQKVRHTGPWTWCNCQHSAERPGPVLLAQHFALNTQWTRSAISQIHT